MELGVSTSYHSKSQPKRSHDDPKHAEFHVFQPPFYSNFGNISQPGQIFSKMDPKIGPRPFPEQFRASKRAPEFRGQKIKRSHGRPVLAFQLLGNFGSSACCTTRQFLYGPWPDPAWIAEQECSAKTCQESSSGMRIGRQKIEMNTGHQKSTLVVKDAQWSSKMKVGPQK